MNSYQFDGTFWVIYSIIVLILTVTSIVSFWRIFEKGTYLHEVYENMPYKGYDIEDKDIRLISQKYYEEYEDRVELIRKVKNFVEGYIDSKNRLKVRFYMYKNDKEFLETARRSHKVFHVK